MKKTMLISIFICIILIFCKYYFSNYEIKYNLNNYEVYTKYNNKRFYIEIKKDEYIYNFDIYGKRKKSKLLINSINELNGDDYNCIYPQIKGYETYPLCYQNGQYIDYSLIDELSDYRKNIVDIDAPDKDFKYYNNLQDNEYVALWNYKGYILMNNKDYEYIELFEKDKYDNTLSYILDDTIYIANYNEEHEYSKLITLNIVTKEIDEIPFEWKIDNDSYFVGNIDEKLYLFDNKHSVLYEINTKNKESKIKCNNETGFFKYVDGKFISCSKTEYKIDKIKYETSNSLYTYSFDNSYIKIINDNNKIKQKLFNNQINLIYEYNNEIYYSYEDYFYKYSPTESSKIIFYNYELTFNSDNTIFVYVK